MKLYFFTIVMPLILGTVALFVPRYLFKYGGITAMLSAATLIIGVLTSMSFYQGSMFSLLLVALSGVFGLLVSMYTIGYFDSYPGFFWALFCWMLAAASGLFLAGSIKGMIIAWIFAGVIPVNALMSAP